MKKRDLTNKEKANVIRELLKDVRRNEKMFSVEWGYMQLLEFIKSEVERLDPPDERIGKLCKVWDGDHEPMHSYEIGVLLEISYGHLAPFVIQFSNDKDTTYGHARLLTEKEKEEF